MKEQFLSIFIFTFILLATPVLADFTLTNLTLTKNPVHLDEFFEMTVNYTSDGEAPTFVYWTIGDDNNKTTTAYDTAYTQGVIYENNVMGGALSPYAPPVPWYGFGPGNHTLKFYASNGTIEKVSDEINLTVLSDLRIMRGGALWILTESPALGYCYDLAADFESLDGNADGCYANRWAIYTGDYESGGQVGQYRGMADFNISGLSSSEIGKAYFFLYGGKTVIHFNATVNHIEGDGSITVSDFNSTSTFIGNFTNNVTLYGKWNYVDVTTNLKNDIDAGKNWTSFRVSGGMEGTDDWFNNDSTTDFIDFDSPKLLIIPKVPILPYGVKLESDDFFVTGDMDWHLPAMINISRATGLRLSLFVDAIKIDEFGRIPGGTFSAARQEQFSFIENNSEKLALQSNPDWADLFNTTDGTHYTEANQRDKLNKTQQVFQDRNLTYDWLVFAPGAGKLDSVTLSITKDYGVKWLSVVFGATSAWITDNESYINNILYMRRYGLSGGNPGTFLKIRNRAPAMQTHKQDFNWSTTSEQNWTDFMNELYVIPDIVPTINDKEAATQWVMYNYANLTWDVPNNRLYINTTPIPQAIYDDDFVHSFVLKLPYTNVTSAAIDDRPVAYSEKYNYTWFRIPFINRSNHEFTFTLGADDTFYNGVIYNGTYLIKNISINSTRVEVELETYGTQILLVKNDFYSVNSVTSSGNVTINSWSHNSSNITIINMSEQYLRGSTDTIVISGTTEGPSTETPTTTTLPTTGGIPTESVEVSLDLTDTIQVLLETQLRYKPKINEETILYNDLESFHEKPTGKVYKFFEINKVGIDNVIISNATISFLVEKDWIDDNNINESTIALYRWSGSDITGSFLRSTGSILETIYLFFLQTLRPLGSITGLVVGENQWVELSTTKVSETTDEILYEAQIPGFSVFSITGQEIITAPTEDEEGLGEVIIPEEPIQFNYIIIIVAIIFLVIIYQYSTRKQTRKKTRK